MAVALAGWGVLGMAEFGVPGSTAGEAPQAGEWEPSCGCGGALGKVRSGKPGARTEL